ncbi:unnamed protein product [Notodromas monacha]|uniref:Renin receptor-like C-terminal transmembrane spanning segment domain-containing protein n=1 Tax=Notodromas monacha TaxID=399045 RepID=A0A7R9BZK7_9CRUS|nr:unnamed protein product [Notodromas monacha]CAG0923478.1 unnamed protein product [Notodromas monacha]
MIRLSVYAFVCIIFVQCVMCGDVWVVKAPQGFVFDSTIPMKQNDVSSVLFRMFGITETSDCTWPGLLQKNPFSSTKRVIVVAVPTSVPITQKFQVPANSLNSSLAPVSHFMDELSALNELPSILENSITPAKALVFEFDSLDAVGRKEDVAEARRLIGTVLAKIADDSDASVLAVCYTPSQKTRSKRQAEPGATAADDMDYVVPFNLVLWLSLALFLITLAVCIGIGSMDPGWDSIIYRMTNPRMKKDN